MSCWHKCNCPGPPENQAAQKSLLCLTLIKKLFRLFAVEIRVVGLRPDVSTVTMVWLLNDTRFQTSEKR